LYVNTACKRLLTRRRTRGGKVPRMALISNMRARP
jgi:hypothetical protein